MYNQTYKYENVKTNIVCDHSQGGAWGWWGVRGGWLVVGGWL